MSILVIGTNKASAAAIVKNSGITPEGTINITESGTYDVTNYASADVDIEGAPEYYIEKTVNSTGVLRNSGKLMKLSGFTDINSWTLAGEYYSSGSTFPAGTTVEFTNLQQISGQSACQCMFQNCDNIISVSFPALTTIAQNGTYAMKQMFADNFNLASASFPVLASIDGPYSMESMFAGDRSLTSISFPVLTTVSGSNAMHGTFTTSGLTSISFPALTTISGTYAFDGLLTSTLITSLEFPELTTISAGNTMNSMCSNCTSLTTVKMNKLTNISGVLCPSSYSQVFSGCTKLENIEFGGFTSATFASLKSQISGLFNSSTGSQAPNGCTIHFPSNFDPENPDHTFDITTLTGYPRFGGNANYIHIAYDLPATE